MDPVILQTIKYICGAIVVCVFIWCVFKSI
jgi:hypothetical protein